MVDVEARRSSRVAARFWVAVEGVDAELAPRRGDLSATGIFFQVGPEVDQVGEVGTVQWLHIASHDRKRMVHVMAHVVRVATLSDVHRLVRGVALEFMPESDEAAAALVDFARYVLEKPEAEGPTPHIAPRVDASVVAGAASPAPATLKELSVRTLLLEADWSVPVGEPVRVEIVTRGVRRPVRVEGRTVSVLPSVGPDARKRFRIAVRVQHEIDGPLRRFSSQRVGAVDAKALAARASEAERARAARENPLDELLSALIEPPASPPEREHLSGLLSRIPFAALCSLLELERLTGELRVRRGDETTTLYVREGRFVDAVAERGLDERNDTSASARDRIAAMVDRREGTFDLVIVPVAREDRVGASMTELLPAAARRSDEASQ
jgi:hypothetical protein